MVKVCGRKRGLLSSALLNVTVALAPMVAVGDIVNLKLSPAVGLPTPVVPVRLAKMDVSPPNVGLLPMLVTARKAKCSERPIPLS